MSLKDKIKDRLNSSDDRNIARELLPSDFQRWLNKFYDDERLSEHFHEMRKGHYLEVGITPQKMTAYLSVYFDKDKPPLGLNDVQMFIAASGISTGLVEEELSKRLDNGYVTRSFVGALISKGTRPTAGVAGFVELLRRPYNPKGGGLLFEFDPVNVDEEIARVHPPQKGTPGVDVLGQEIPCAMTADAEYRMNHLIKSLNLGNETSLIAAAKGHIHQDGNQLILNEILNVNDDITSNLGTLTYNNDVNVYGDICENTTLNVDGNVTVNGMISSSEMIIGSNLRIAQGIFGRGQAQIIVKKDLHCRYINEAQVFADGSILLQKEAMNSTLWSKERIESPNSNFVGGRTFAHDGLDVFSLGSELGLTSVVSVGLDYQEYRIEKELKPKIEELEGLLEEVIQEFKKSNAKMKKVLMERMNDLKAEIENRKAEIQTLEQHIKEQNPRATIQVRNAVYPGPTLMVGFHEYLINEKIDGPVEFFLDKDEVHARKVNLN